MSSYDSLAARVKPRRLAERFHAIAAIGALPGGGCERLAFSREERAAHAEFRRQAALGRLVSWVDGIGNSFARLEPRGAGRGPQPGCAPILTGSHLDTVAQGGCYDGAAGVLCSLEAVLALEEAQAAGEFELSRPVEVVAWANEEGARFAPAMMGSAVYAGVMSLREALASRDREGSTVAEAVAAGTEPRDGSGVAGAGEASVPSGPPEAGLRAPAPAAYLELHIEQGVELQEAGIPVAIVEGVQAQVAGDWEFRGRSAHAGATPMHRRADALVAAAELVGACPQIAGRHTPGVATVGSLTVEPGSRNSVPGSVGGSVDLRHPEENEVAAMAKEFVAAGEAAAKRHGCEFDYSELWRTPRVAFDSALLETFSAAAGRAGVAKMRLFSAAGHDAVHMARLAPAAMLFVPSIGGVSHHPDEETRMADLVAGARVLAEALGTLAAKSAE